MEDKDKQILSLKAKMRAVEKERDSLKEKVKDLQDKISKYEEFLGVKKDA